MRYARINRCANRVRVCSLTMAIALLLMVSTAITAAFPCIHQAFADDSSSIGSGGVPALTPGVGSGGVPALMPGVGSGGVSALTPGLIPGTGLPGVGFPVQIPEYLYGNPSSKDGYISLSGRKSGAASYNPKTKTLTLNNVTCESGTLSIKVSAQPIKVNLKGANTIQSTSSDSSLTFVGPGTLVGNVDANQQKATGVKVSSGTVKGNIASSAAFRMAGGVVKGDVASGANVKIAGGAIKGDVMVGTTFAMAGGAIKGRVFAYNGAAKMAGGTVNGTLSTHKKLTMAGGKIVRSGGSGYSVICYGLYMTKGSISIKNCTYGVSVHGNKGVAHNLKMTGGKIVVVAPEYEGVSVSGGNLVQTGGTISVKGAKRDAVTVSAAQYGDKSFGGKAQINGGSFTATVADPSSRYALFAKSVSNKVHAIKTIKGHVGQGMQFKRGGNLYKVMNNRILSDSGVKLVKYGSSKKQAVVNKVTFGGCVYSVEGIAAGAFNTKMGRKVTSIVIASNIKEIGANAFAYSKLLKVLRFNSVDWMKRNYGFNLQLESVTVDYGCNVSVKAFSKCGKDGSRSLTVALGKNGVQASEAPKYKRFLVKHGLSHVAKLRTHA